MWKIKANVIMATSAAVALLVFACAAQAEDYVSESFSGSTAPQWTFINAIGDGPVLTGNGTIDPVGGGWLRLTDAKTYQNSFVYYNNAIPTSYGLIFSFDFVIWSPTSSNADGFALTIFDVEASPVATGGWGGSLGYAQHTSNGGKGMNGGIAGFGFDTFGNFSSATEGRIGGPGKRPNSIALRGSMGASRTLGYEYITGVYGLAAFSKGSASSRSAAVVYSVRLKLSPAKEISIEWKPQGGEWVTLLDKYKCTLTCPSHIKFGFTGSTGSVYSNQEIRNVVVSSLEKPPCDDDEDCEDGKLCNTGTGECVTCLGDADCDDGVFCNGEETCVEGVCVAGTSDCAEGEYCDEENDKCVDVDCHEDGNCSEGYACVDDVCVEDQPPVFLSEPLWVGPWMGLSSDPANPHKPQSKDILFWAYDDDRLACKGGAAVGWKYRPVALQDGVVVPLSDWVVKEPWRFLWFVWIETPGIAEIAGPGLFEFKMTATDCLDQEIDSEGFWGKRYYFQVD